MLSFIFIGKEGVFMWIMLALALLVLQFNRNFSIILLMISAAIGLINNTIDWSVIHFYCHYIYNFIITTKDYKYYIFPLFF